MPPLVPLAIGIGPYQLERNDGPGLGGLLQQLESCGEHGAVLALVVHMAERVAEGEFHRYGAGNADPLRDVGHHRDHHRREPRLLDAISDQDDRPAAIWSGGSKHHRVNSVFPKMRDDLGQVAIQEFAGIELKAHERVMARSHVADDALGLELS